MVLFIIYEVYVIFARKHPAVSIKQVHHDLRSDPGRLMPFKLGFDIAIGLTTANKSI